MLMLLKMCKKHIDDLLIFVFCIAVFSYILQFVSTDIQTHIRQIQTIRNGTASYPPNFVFYFIVNMFSCFSGKLWLLNSVTVLLLSFATTAKYSITKKILTDLFHGKADLQKTNKIRLLALGLFFCFAIPDFFNIKVLDQLYLGRMVPVVWHNSTTIFVFPFAIWLFWMQLNFTRHNHKPSSKELLGINFLVIINILIKPSFAFVYLPVTFFMVAQRMRTVPFKRLFLYFTPILTGGCCIILQYILIYIFQQGSFQDQPSGVEISAPFEVLKFWMPGWYIPIAFFLSLAFPIYSLIAFRGILKFRPFTYALALTVMGILLFAFVKESGPRMYHGNFVWQNYICVYLLFLATVAYQAPVLLKRKPGGLKLWATKVIFLLHAASGVFYLIRIVATGIYK
jgi:hypothetical protein